MGKDDWRLFKGQEEYLKNVVLIEQKYKPKSKLNDHDHCEFCMSKFSGSENDLNFGYSTLDRDIWICVDCYNDFKNDFNWVISQTCFG